MKKCLIDEQFNLLDELDVSKKFSSKEFKFMKLQALKSANINTMQLYKYNYKIQFIS